jgi:guanine deaminase
MIAGKVMMDRNAPDYLTDTAESSYVESKALIERWHGKGRLHYAVTPRFAPTSTPEQLTLAGQLLSEYPDLYMQTHISENLKEIEWVKALFPERKGYLDVYDHYQLLGERSVFAHGVHLCDDECARLAETGSAMAFCPTSNCSWAAACSTCRWPRNTSSTSAWAPTWAAAPVSRCCKP